MAENKILFFAGLARDCADNLEANLNALMRLINSNDAFTCKLFLLENDSKDESGAILNTFKNDHPALVNLWQIPGLALVKPARIERLAWCRNFLLERILDSEYGSLSDAIYVPLDLDAEIVTSLNACKFWEAVDCLVSSSYRGLFPASFPYYYDLLALRCPGWVEADHRELVAAARPTLGWFKSLDRYVYSLQYPIQFFASKSVIPVLSAFGGVGIYKLSAVANSRYKTTWLGHCFECEHVDFNQHVQSLGIYGDLVVQAPQEHIRFQLMSESSKAWFWIICALKDLIHACRIHVKIGR